MGHAKFPLPTDLLDIVSLLNASREWNLSLVEADAGIRLIDGDQLMFTASGRAEAEAFLAGCFLATFYGKDLQQIQAEIQAGRFDMTRDWDDIHNDIEMERRNRHKEKS